MEWDPPDDQGPHGSSNHIDQRQQFHFFPHSGYDLIELDAVNEASCAQVLRILINKADTEIMGLEEEILMLQGQLAWTDKTWSQLCSAAFRETIEGLTNLLQRLKNHDSEDELEFALKLARERKPAETLAELLKALLGQSSSSAEKLATRTTEEEVALRDFKSKDSVTNASENTIIHIITKPGVRAKDKKSHKNDDIVSGNFITNADEESVSELKGQPGIGNQKSVATEVGNTMSPPTAEKVNKYAHTKKLGSIDPLKRKTVSIPGRAIRLDTPVIETKPTILDSLLEKYDRYAREPLMNVKENLPTDEVQNSEVVVMIQRDSSSSMKSEIVEEPCLAVEFDFQPKCIERFKRQHLTGIAEKVANNLSRNKKKNKKNETHLAEVAGGTAEVSITGVSQTRKRKKPSVSSQVTEGHRRRRILKMKLAVYGDDTRCSVEEVIVSSDNEGIAPHSRPASLQSTRDCMTMHSMKLNALRAIAKERKLKGFAKLRKGELLNRILHHEQQNSNG